jgi:hypothetical protein
MDLFKAINVKGEPVYLVARNLHAASDYLRNVNQYPSEIVKVEGRLLLLEPITELK